MGKDEQASRNVEKNHALWDPVNAWPAGRKWIWVILTTLVVIAQGALLSE